MVFLVSACYLTLIIELSHYRKMISASFNTHVFQPDEAHSYQSIINGLLIDSLTTYQGIRTTFDFRVNHHSNRHLHRQRNARQERQGAGHGLPCGQLNAPPRRRRRLKQQLQLQAQRQ